MKKIYILIVLFCFSINLFSQLGMSYNIIDVTSCVTPNGEIIVNGNGGTPPYEYSIDGGGFYPNNHFTGLSPMVYEIGVKDNVGAEYYENITVENNSGIAIDSVIYDDILCYGDTTSTITIYPNLTNALYSIDGGVCFSPSNIFINIGAGTYSISVIDTATMCTNIYILNIAGPNYIDITLDTIINATNGICNGLIDIIVTGGTVPLSYSWNTGDTTENLNNLCAGYYSITVTDTNNCQVYDDFIIENEYDSTITTFVDTATTIIDTCLFNTSIPVDSASIYGFDIISPDSAITHWVFWQAGSPIYLDVIVHYTIGTNLIYLEIICISKTTNIYKFYGVFNSTTVGIQNAKKILNLRIYPNPTTGKITVRAEDIESIEVYDITGKHLTGFENLSGLKEIDLSTQPKGMYIIKVRTSKGVVVRKVVLE